MADGEAEAIREVYGAIHEGDPSPDLLAIKYLETLGRIANGQATKIFLPAELAGLAGAVSAVSELVQGVTDDDGDGTGVDGGAEGRLARAQRAAGTRDERAARREADRAEIAAESARRDQLQAAVVAEAQALAPDELAPIPAPPPPEPVQQVPPPPPRLAPAPDERPPARITPGGAPRG